MYSISKYHRNFTRIPNLFRRTFRFSTEFDKERFYISRASGDDHEEVTNLFWQTYTAQEPCYVGFRLENTQNHTLEGKFKNCLNQNLTLVVRSKEDASIAAVAVNSIISPWDFKDHYLFEAQDCKTIELIRFYEFIRQTTNVFYKYEQSKVFDVSYLFVRPKNKSSGMAGKLIEFSRILCSDAGQKLMKVDCTNEFVSRICKRQNFKLEWEMPFSEYVDSKGKQIILPPPPHYMIRVYVDSPRSPMI